jgi:hypothetical protein
VKKISTIVAFAAVLAAAGPALAQSQRNVDGGPPQQGAQGTETSANAQVNQQANYQADYHADYRLKTSADGPKTPGDDPKAQQERDRFKPRDPFSKLPPFWPR